MLFLLVIVLTINNNDVVKDYAKLCLILTLLILEKELKDLLYNIKDNSHQNAKTLKSTKVFGEVWCFSVLVA